MDTLDFVNTFDFHRKNPEQSLDDYYRSLRIDLSKEVLGKTIVYLDTNFWVNLRKGLLDPEDNLLERKLLGIVLELSEKKLCVFPISEDVFWEVIKQTDETTLKATVDLIDKLSNGVSIISNEERIKLEIIHFWYTLLGKKVYETRELVWTKLPYLLGLHSFDTPQLDLKEIHILNKAFVDQMWPISMRQMVETILDNGGFKNLPEVTFAKMLNEGKFKHENEAKSFNQMFLNEVRGIVDVYKDDLADMMEYMYKKEQECALSDNESKAHREETKRLMGNMIYNLFRHNKVGIAMPVIRISSALHAAVRWDKKQKYQDHDFHDFRHAANALPYCDYFFTEKRLHHLLCQKSLSFNELYDCEVQSKVASAIESLSKVKGACVKQHCRQD